MATSRCNARHDGVTEVEDLVLKGLERPWTFSNNSALSVGFFSILFLSLPVACSWAWSSSSSALLYSSLSCKLMRLLSPEVLSCHSTTMCFHLRKTDPILDMGENRWECWEWVPGWAQWAPRLLPLLHPFAIVQDVLFATASGCRESHCFEKNLFHQTWWRIGYLPPNIAQYVCFKIFRKWSFPTNVIEQSRCFPIWLLRSAMKAGK